MLGIQGRKRPNHSFFPKKANLIFDKHGCLLFEKPPNTPLADLAGSGTYLVKYRPERRVGSRFIHGGSDVLRRALARLCNKTRLQRANIIGHCAANTRHTDYPEAQPPDASEMRSPALLPCAFDGARSRSTRGLCPANAPATISHGTATACGACHQPAGIHIARPVWRVTGSHQRTPALPLT